ncbi:hypothetical protein D3C78_1102790 [compost metagenome]
MPTALGHGLGQPIAEQHAVGQLGEHVVLQQVGHLEQFLDALFDGAFQAAHFPRRILGQLPFPGHGAGHLADFQGVEGFLEDQQLIVELDPFGHGFPGVVRERRAQGDLQARVGLPQRLDGLQAVPARRHTHVGEHQRIGLAFGLGALDQFQRLLALVGRVDLELQPIDLRGAE